MTRARRTARCRARLWLALALLGARAVTAAAAPPGCAAPAEAAERRHGLPAGLLRAVGTVESGRWDQAARAVLASPYAVNAAGESRFFASPAEAAAFVAERQRQGVRLIDVGCFQIDLFYHPDAFARLEDGFDPEANAEYAARFLERLHAATGDWARAVADYHSARPDPGRSYAASVLAAWGHAPPPAARAEPRAIGAGTSDVVFGMHVQRPGDVPGIATGIRMRFRLPATITPAS